jgi:hypothetical protein
MNPQIIPIDVLKQKVPSAFATHPHSSRSEKYSFIPTEKLIDDMSKMEWYPTYARQDGSKVNAGFQKHMLRFRKNFEEGLERYPELLLINSHNGRSRCIVYGGFIEAVCSNGLISVSLQSQSSFKILHMHYTFSNIESLVKNIIDDVNLQAKNIKNFIELELDETKKMWVAKQAASTLYPDQAVQLPSLLNVRRPSQERNDLWTVWNVIQENVIKGGVKFAHTNKETTSREVKNIRKEVFSNLALWAILADSYKTLKK